MKETRPAEAAERLRALVLHPVLRPAHNGGAGPEAALEEACGLTRALDALELVDARIVPLAKPRPSTLFGSGKVREIKQLIDDAQIGIVIVNGTVSPVQQRNLEKAWQVKLLDRTALILEIFGDRARSQEGVLQVELAHLSYQRSRLVRSWTHLERQRGGFGFLGGPGETQIEADRRALDERIHRIRSRLAEVARTRRLHRRTRQRQGYPTIALVGYTNAGKSTLFNRLTGESVMARDMPFATLDPTMRALELPGGITAILSDTVGFISDLPTQLIAAFRATLEEVIEADLIVHVRDMSSPQTEAQAEDVRKVLADLGIDPSLSEAMIEFRNKSDLVPDLVRGTRDPRIIWGSAKTGDGLEELRRAMAAALAAERHCEHLSLGMEHGAALAWLKARDLVKASATTDSRIDLDLRWSERERGQFRRAFPDIAI